MNFLEGELSDDATMFHSGAWSLSLNQSRISGNETSKVKLGFRPEDIVIDDQGTPARVAVVEPIGHEIIVVFDADGSEIVGRFSPDVKMRADDTVRLSPRPEKLHVFATADGRRLNREHD